jgi:3-deoxy-D-manno-octulosonate 8-phosphate phosphatase KdsC-like HAD superfamily phosphatase
MGNVLFKQYYGKDFEAINRIKKMLTFVFLSSDEYVNYNMCKKRNIPFYHTPNNKKGKLVEIMRRYQVTPENIMYVGCTYSDIESMKLSEISICSEDSPASVKNIADYVLPAYGGIGVLCELYELLRKINLEKELDK